MSGYVENAMPIATATIYGFDEQRVTGLVLAALVQQYALENDEDFAVARRTDNSGESYIVGLTSGYASKQVAVIPSLEKPWLRADQQYKLLQIVTCQWGGSFDIFHGVGHFTESVSKLASHLDSKLRRSNADVPRYKRVPFSTAPTFNPDIYLF